MNGIFSSRNIEEAYRRDLNFMYLLERNHTPANATIARFPSLYLAACSKDALARMTDILAKVAPYLGSFLREGSTKIESAANKYTFIWKKGSLSNVRVAASCYNVLRLIPDCWLGYI